MSEWEGDLARSRDMCTLIPEPRGAGLIIQRLHSPAWGRRGDGKLAAKALSSSLTAQGQPPARAVCNPLPSIDTKPREKD